jgi:hypothetical protein
MQPIQPRSITLRLGLGPRLASLPERSIGGAPDADAADPSYPGLGQVRAKGKEFVSQSTTQLPAPIH